MLRSLLSIVAILVLGSVANAHFVFVVPQAGGHQAKVILSEDLNPDADVDISIISGVKLVRSDLKGATTQLVVSKGDHALTVDLPGDGVIYGSVDVDVEQHGKGKPFLLAYYPKTVLGDGLDPATHLSIQTPVELVMLGEPGKVRFQMLAAGKPVGGAQINLVLPNGTKQKVTTDEQGETGPFSSPGRYGVWSRHFETIAGEKDGKKYDEIHRYATLVVDVAPATVVTRYPDMPEAASSFGSVVCDGWLYIYGGHVVDTHNYDTASVSGHFNRMNLATHKTWEKLPAGPALQGLNLATYSGKVYRVGGMNPRNKPGTEADVQSVAESACFDPATLQWTALPVMLQARSSHDVVVVGHQLLVIGGWTLSGDPDDAKWLDSALSLDLSDRHSTWEPVKQPFERRAFIAASYHNRAYVIGGFSTESEPTTQVDIYDPASDGWSSGPELPGSKMNGFGAAACVMSDQLYVSVADGTLYRLNEKDKQWDRVVKTTPRIVHRLASDGSQILVIGGAIAKKQSKLIEAVQVVN